MKTLTSLKSALTGLAGLVLAITAGQASAEILGSVHDFSGGTGEICVNCHTPHKADTTVTDAPLWNHTLTTKDYSGLIYSSGTLNATVELPGGASKLCLSCHDGTVAIDAFGGAAGGVTIGAGSSRNIGGDGLQNDHPISFTYDAALVTADGGLSATDTSVTVGHVAAGFRERSGTIADTLLISDKVECSSCHDVHNNFVSADTDAKLLKISMEQSGLCRTCHTK